MPARHASSEPSTRPLGGSSRGLNVMPAYLPIGVDRRLARGHPGLLSCHIADDHQRPLLADKSRCSERQVSKPAPLAGTVVTVRLPFRHALQQHIKGMASQRNASKPPVTNAGLGRSETNEATCRSFAIVGTNAGIYRVRHAPAECSRPLQHVGDCGDDALDLSERDDEQAAPVV